MSHRTGHLMVDIEVGEYKICEVFVMIHNNEKLQVSLVSVRLYPKRTGWYTLDLDKGICICSDSPFTPEEAKEACEKVAEELRKRLSQHNLT